MHFTVSKAALHPATMTYPSDFHWHLVAVMPTTVFPQSGRAWVCTSHRQERGDQCHIHPVGHRRVGRGIHWHWHCKRFSVYELSLTSKIYTKATFIKVPWKAKQENHEAVSKQKKKNVNSLMSINHVQVSPYFYYTRQWLPWLNTGQRDWDCLFLQPWLTVLYPWPDVNSTWRKPLEHASSGHKVVLLSSAPT